MIFFKTVVTYSNSPQPRRLKAFSVLFLVCTNYLVLCISSVNWFKDNEPYPWTNFGSSLPVLFAKNQSLVIVNMTPKDEGQYKCVASGYEDEV